MKPPEFDPRRLDVRALAKAQGVVAGRWPLAALSRLADMLAEPEPAGEVAWQAQGSERAVRGGSAEPQLVLSARAELPLLCQRCLDPVRLAVVVERRFVFVRDEAQAEQRDGETDEEVLALTRELDLQALVEDELLLELPLVPRHDHCEPPNAAAGPSTTADDRPHPFAALAGLRRPGR